MPISNYQPDSHYAVKICAIVIFSIGTIYTLLCFDMVIYALMALFLFAVIAFIFDRRDPPHNGDELSIDDHINMW